MKLGGKWTERAPQIAESGLASGRKVSHVVPRQSDRSTDSQVTVMTKKEPSNDEEGAQQ